ncbi:hypothetical protein POM88_007758 [Heracleum sosnowskyi]|uniref:KEN domain-containing protein n=1 Tax=Heracleum sosnowskyi TaxID=360622 RepID=A0AAD8J507_9APIA|nr:hypothetical protein POM88_007758 [Heracleum sosnowskyi]
MILKPSCYKLKLSVKTLTPEYLKLYTRISDLSLIFIFVEMLSFLRRVLRCDDELTTGQSDSDHVIPNNYDSFSTTNLLSAQTQSQNYSTFDFPQRFNTPSVYNQPKHVLPRLNAQANMKVNPKKTPNIRTATHANVFPESTSSYLLLPSVPSHKPSLSTKPHSLSTKPHSLSTKSILAHSTSTPTSNQTKSQCNLVEKGSTPLNVIPEDNKGLIRKDIVPEVLTYQDYFTKLLNAEDYYPKVPAKRSLADYLTESGPRLVSLYGSTELYPTDETRCIIQGMVTAILNLKKDKRKHNYLRNPENLILDDKECHPYSNYVRDLATGHVLRNRKILEQAGKDFPTTIKVTLEKNRMGLRSDDLAALKYLIFDVILVLDHDKKPLLPAEWRSFKELFSNTELDYAVLSSHPCLWGYQKRLGFYFALNKWRKPCKSEKEVMDIVDDNLSSMQIFRTNWVKKIKRDSHLLKFTGKMTHSRKRKVYELIRFFRNLVEHCADEASASSPYRKERYLDYKLRTIYPNLLEELHQRLLLAGFDY